MAHKPVQDIYTVVIFVTFILLLVVAGMQATTIIEDSGIVQPGISMARVPAARLQVPAIDMPVQESHGYNDCEVIYHQAAWDSEYAASPMEPEQDVMATLYYAVYTCSGTAVIANGYI